MKLFFAGLLALFLSFLCQSTPLSEILVENMVLSAGHHTTCFLKEDQVFCWGEGR